MALDAKTLGLARAWLATAVLVIGLALTMPVDAGTSQGPQRIISLIPAVTEMLFAIGAGDQVIGVSSYVRYPPAALERTRVGALVDPDVERILSLRPDLVIVYRTQDDLIARLERASIPLFRYQHAGMADITQTMRQLGTRVGREREATQQAAAIEAAIGETRQRVANRPHPRTALVIGREPGGLRGLYVSAGVGFMHDMLEAAGGTDVFDDVKRQSLQVSSELILARAPDVILETHPPEGWDAARRDRERLLWSRLPAIPAVRTNRIYILTNDVVLVPGPRVADGVRLMAETLHPDAFGGRRD